MSSLEEEEGADIVVVEVEDEANEVALSLDLKASYY
ncbi:hypothetical protein A2U01_0102745, partial [Trifolium medium]|nr:hypothetical protein [Trifolium medium]